MTPVFQYEKKPVVRFSGHNPSPFLVKQTGLLKSIRNAMWLKGMPARAIDIGCGNGRNSRFLDSLSFDVIAFDRKPDYGCQFELGKHPLPLFANSINVVLLQYVFMFLDMESRNRVAKQCMSEVVTSPSMVIVEMQEVKNGLMNKLEIFDWMDELVKHMKGGKFSVEVNYSLARGTVKMRALKGVDIA